MRLANAWLSVYSDFGGNSSVRSSTSRFADGGVFADVFFVIFRPWLFSFPVAIASTSETRAFRVSCNTPARQAELACARGLCKPDVRLRRSRPAHRAG